MLMLSTISLFAQIPAYVPTNGLVAWYPFNGNANDESGNGNNGTVMGSVSLTTDRFGISDKSYNFPGSSNSYIECGLSNSLRVQNAITISVWVLMNGGTLNPRIISSEPNFCAGYQMSTVGSSNSNRTISSLIVNNNGAGSGFSISSISALVWHNLIMSVDANGYGKFYVDGQLVFSGQGTPIVNPTYCSNLNIGRKSYSAFDAFGGKIDDIAIYNRALTPQEISALYTGIAPCQPTSSTSNLTVPSTSLPYTWNGLTFNNAGTQTATLTNAAGCDSSATLNLTVTNTLPNYLPTNGLVGYWPFNGNANDESGNENHGTVNGATLASDRFGNSGKAYGFDGNDDNVLVQNSSSLMILGDITLSAWIKTQGYDQLHNYQTIISKRQQDYSWQYSMAASYHFPYAHATKLITSRGNGPGNQDQVWSQTPIITNTWEHWACVYSGNEIRIYRNGILNSTGFNDVVTPIQNGVLLFGQSVTYNNNEQFLGSLDDIAIYNRALTPQEITALYTGVPPCQPTSSTTNLTIPSTDLPYTWNGLTFNNAGTQTATLTNAAGCDSSATLNLTVTNTVPNYLPSNGLVGWWPFNGNANDESGNGNHGTVNGATLTSDRFGNVGKAYDFDGVDDFIFGNANSSLIMSNQITISSWVNTQSNAQQRIFTLGNDQNIFNFQYSLFTTSQNAFIKLYFIAYGQNSNFEPQGPNVSSGSLVSNSWNLLVVTYDGVSLKYFINGTLDKQISISDSFIQNQFLKFLIGKRSDNSEIFNGKLDDIAIYNRALTPQEIAAMYSGCTVTDSSSFSASACNLYTLPWGDTVAQSGTYVHTYTNNGGCDSIVTAQIIINTASDSTQGTTVTATGSYTLPSGSVATESGYYTHTYANQYGCDSTVTFYVVINQSNDSTQSNHVGINVNQPQRSLHVRDVIRLEPRNTPPSNPTKGDLYFDGNRDVLRYYNGRRWVDVD